jgi:CDP-glucose 4,6-dehydratase
MVIDQAFWQGKKVLLTGHTGFKGSWLTLWLQSMGADIMGLSLAPPTEPNLYTAARVAEATQGRLGDIREYGVVEATMTAFRPEIVLHMAAQSLVRASYEDPIATYATNVMGTVHVLEAARRAGTVRSVVNVTTDKCYENQEWVWGYRETDPMGGHDPYSSSKGCAEIASGAYRRSFLAREGIAMATARAGNVIGGGDWAAARLVPDILRALESAQPVLIRSPDAVRPWQHVLEPLSGYLLLAQRLYEQGHAVAEGWNFGPSDEDTRSVQWIVERMCQQWGTGARWTLQPGDHPHEAASLKLDVSKARQRLRWRPRWSLDTALAETIRWHKAWLDGRDMRAFCLEQISQYQSN